jgi:TolB-like protein/class 3 adenylate cyclase
MANERVERRLAAILAADVVGYGRLTSAAEEDTHVRLKEHLRVLIDPKITEYSGRVVKNTGDGMLAEFSSVVDAVRCAVEIQRGMADRNVEVPEDKRIQFRIGVNLGDVIVDSGDIFGTGVNVAVRLEGIADPGGICVSERVREYAQDQLEILFEDAGEHQLKNIARPVRAYHVRIPAFAHNIEVKVTPRFDDKRSLPASNYYFWAYSIEIVNHGSETVQLMTRHWRITDALGRCQEIRGPGVVGEHPVLEPGRSYQYTSGVPLPTPSGFMVGTYRMATPAGRHFDVDVPAFSLESPNIRPALTIPSKPSIAVLPFQNLSGDPEQEYFADGMVEEIITALSRFHELFVIARNSSFTYKGRAVDVKHVARDLGVRYVLEGSVRKFGSRLRIMAQLIDASAGTHLWADRFEGGLEDIFELQDRVASTVVGTIGSKLQEAEIERVRRKPTESLDAYDCYLRGMANLHRGATDEALTLFCNAIELDPTFVSPYAMAARCYARRFYFGQDREGDQAEAERLATCAARFGANDAMALSSAAMAFLFASRDLEFSLALVERALVLNPNLGYAWFVSSYVRLCNGDLDLAIGHFECAVRFNPFDPSIGTLWQGIAFAHFLAGRYDQSLSASERGLPSSVSDLTMLAASSALAGRLDKARATMARIRERDPNLCISTLKALVPLRRPEDIARWAEGLRMAGLPE